MNINIKMHWVKNIHKCITIEIIQRKKMIHTSIPCIEHKNIRICINTQQKQLIHSFIPTFNMFIVIHKKNIVVEIKYKRILILKRSWPTTSYVAATFHPTIGRWAHQSLSIIATPELGMIPQGTREQQAHS